MVHLTSKVQFKSGKPSCRPNNESATESAEDTQNPLSGKTCKEVSAQEEGFVNVCLL